MKIIKETETDKVEGTLLGQRVSAPTTYTPEILVKVPRSENREQYNITNADFKGIDNWYCYECSALTATGAPIYFGMVISYPADSEYIVESKSLKLYLNSFNMERMAMTDPGNARCEFMDLVQADLTELLSTEVTVESFTHEDFVPGEGFGYRCKVKLENIVEEFTPLESLVDYSSIDIGSEEFQENWRLLEYSNRFADRKFKISFSGFRSNCKVTHQPDYATVFIEYAGDEGVDFESLMRYLTSFRNESHFHEECCEVIFKRLLTKFEPKLLWVRCNYTRRGGIDINPTRYISRPGYSGAQYYSRTIYQ